MTEPGQPHSTTDQQQEQFNQPRSKNARETPKYLLAASITLLVFVLITAAIVVSMRGRTHPTAERAWVTVQEARIIGHLVQHNTPIATVLLKNVGHSPALMTKARLVMTVWTSHTFPDWEMPLKLTTEAKSVGDVYPGSVVSQTVSLITPLTDVQGMHLERKDWFIVILGVVTYTDAFGNPHKTKLCLIWRDTSKDSLSLCEKWNDAD